MRTRVCVYLVVFVQLVVVAKCFDSQGITLNVLDRGAVGDGRHNDTGAIQGALDKCEMYDSCTVILPSGYTFYSYPLQIRASNTQLIIDGEIRLPSYDDAKHSWEQINGEYVPFLSADSKKKIHNIAIAGNGTINGNGDKWWEESKKRKISRPMLIVIDSVDGVELSYLTLLHSPSIHVQFTHCKNVLVYRLSIIAPGDSPNTDGIDTTDCTDVVIRECSISNGDDCVAIKNECNNVLVEDCFFQYGHGASIGSINRGLTSNITFRNIDTDSLLYSLRIKVWNGTNGRVENVTYENVVMTNSTIGFYIDMFYGDNQLHNFSAIPHYDTPQSNLISNIRFNNVVGHEVEAPGFFICSYCDNIYMNDVQIITRTGKHHYTEKFEPYFQCVNAYGVANNTSPKPCLLSQ